METKKWNIVNISLLYLSLVALFSALSYGQGPPQPHIPTKKQFNELYKQRAKVYKVQQKMADLQTQQGFETQEFLKKCDEIIMKNGWSKDLKCDFQTFNFVIPYQPPPQVKPQDDKPKDDKK